MVGWGWMREKKKREIGTLNQNFSVIFLPVLYWSLMQIWQSLPPQPQTGKILPSLLTMVSPKVSPAISDKEA